MENDREIQESSLGSAVRVIIGFVAGAWHSPLKKYVAYSIIIHVLLIGVFSVGSAIELTKGIMGIEPDTSVEKPSDGDKKPGEAGAKPAEGKGGETAKSGENAGPPPIEDAQKPEEGLPTLEDMLK